jgi:hypothetical protein
MNPLAANRTTAHPHLAAPAGATRCSYVEDLNWPAALPTPDKKPVRPIEMWVPGPNGQWEGVTPTLH